MGYISDTQLSHPPLKKNYSKGDIMIFLVNDGETPHTYEWMNQAIHLSSKPLKDSFRGFVNFMGNNRWMAYVLSVESIALAMIASLLAPLQPLLSVLRLTTGSCSPLLARQNGINRFVSNSDCSWRTSQGEFSRVQTTCGNLFLHLWFDLLAFWSRFS